MTTEKQARFELLMDAGNGAQKAGDILIKSFARAGYYVYIEPLIPAEISPPKRTPNSMSGAVIRLSIDPLTNIGSYTEFMLFEHEILLDRRLDDAEYGKNAVALLDMGDSKRAKDAYDAAIERARKAGIKVIPFEISEEAQGHIRDLNGNGKNMYYLGVMTAVFNADVAVVEDLIRTTFKKLSAEKLDKNVAIYKQGVDVATKDIEPRITLAAPKEDSGKDDYILMDGNMAMSMGIIDAGIKVFAGYPITPASSIMHTLAKLFPNYGGVLHQAEDEISAIGAVVGSYFAGVPAITATSGPGLSLKQEFIGLATVAEIPCIVIDVQRGGPSTGLPTRTEQSDLFAAGFGSHGDNTKVLLSVANAEDCFYAPHVARYLSEKLRTPVLILSDYITSVSYKVFKKLDLCSIGDDVNQISDEVLARFKLKRLPDTIEMVKDNQSVPGLPEQMRRVTGLNTDSSGDVVYSPGSNSRSHRIRNEKLHHVRRAMMQPEIIGDTEGDLLIVGWGSSRGAILESVEKARAEGIKVSGLHFTIVYPLPAGLSDIFAKFKRVVTVEMAYGDEIKQAPLAMMLRSETLVDIRAALSEATGRPLKPAQVLSKIKELV